MRRREFLTTVAAARLLPQAANGRASAQAPRPARAAQARRRLILAAQVPVRQGARDGQGLRRQVHQLQGRPPPAHRSARAPSRPRAPRPRPRASPIMGGGTITMARTDEAAQVRKDFEYAKLAGMPLIVAAPSIRRARRVEKLAKEFQIKVAIHNHGPEDKFFPSPHDVYKQSRAATRSWACASTSATRGAPASIRPRRSSSCATASTISTSRI